VLRVTVSMKGKDGQLHTVDCEAESLFRAANFGMQKFAKLCWFSSEAVIELTSGTDTWLVSQNRVREVRTLDWRKTNRMY
jgi:hypothetical protein